MAAVEVTISGVLYDKLNRTTQPVVLIGEASLTGLGIGGGPIIPPPGGGGSPGVPTHPIMLPGMPGWGVPPGAHPSHPIAQPGDPWWGQDLHPSHPIVIPPNVPPGLQPPTPPNPGDPTTPVPPPAGQAGWPVQPITVPPYIVVNYPGIGPVVVAPPAQTTPTS